MKLDEIVRACEGELLNGIRKQRFVLFQRIPELYSQALYIFRLRRKF